MTFGPSTIALSANSQLIRIHISWLRTKHFDRIPTLRFCVFSGVNIHYFKRLCAFGYVSIKTDIALINNPLNIS